MNLEDNTEVAFEEPNNAHSPTIRLPAPLARPPPVPIESVAPSASQGAAAASQSQNAQKPASSAVIEAESDEDPMLSQIRVHVLLKGIKPNRGMGSMKEMIAREYFKKAGVKAAREKTKNKDLEIYLKNMPDGSVTAHVGFEHDYEGYKVATSKISLELPLLSKGGGLGNPECEITELFKYLISKSESALKEQMQQWERKPRTAYTPRRQFVSIPRRGGYAGPQSRADNGNDPYHREHSHSHKEHERSESAERRHHAEYRRDSRSHDKSQPPRSRSRSRSGERRRAPRRSEEEKAPRDHEKYTSGDRVRDELVVRKEDMAPIRSVEYRPAPTLKEYRPQSPAKEEPRPSRYTPEKRVINDRHEAVAHSGSRHRSGEDSRSRAKSRPREERSEPQPMRRSEGHSKGREESRSRSHEHSRERYSRTQSKDYYYARKDSGSDFSKNQSQNRNYASRYQPPGSDPAPIKQPAVPVPQQKPSEPVGPGVNCHLLGVPVDTSDAQIVHELEQRKIPSPREPLRFIKKSIIPICGYS